MALPNDYAERVYAGVLGKLIGVYLGRPFEGWTYERIMRELGEINYYVHEQRGTPLIVTDDDISGTFTFLRAMPDYGNERDLTAQQIGQTWLNYIIEKKTILWWGGMGNSTEHTAFLRLKHGIHAPQSGSIELNGKVVAEQIGSQIFIDGWGMIAPGDPELAVDLALRAASVSHDGEAIYGAQVIAAMEAQAFAERDLHKLLDIGTGLIPRDSIISRLISDIRDWHEQYRDWRVARECIEERYGYHIYGGNCHMIPNHALIILGLLYGDDNFQRSLMITNTAGWDTDCNSGNVGCLLGIKNGLAGIDAGPDWRGPVADRLYLPTADGGRSITDAVAETFHVVNIGRALQGAELLDPKNGARYHFELPGSVQGFRPEDTSDTRGTVAVENVEGHSKHGHRSLQLRYQGLAPGRTARVSTATFIPPEAINLSGYGLFASPTLYSGQTVRAGLAAADTNTGPATCRLYMQLYGANDALTRVYGPEMILEPGTTEEVAWRVPPTDGQPIAAIGVELGADEHGAASGAGAVYLDFLDWKGTPEARFTHPTSGGTMWRRAWVAGVDHYDRWYPEPYRIIQDEGTGLLIQGTREWTDYTVSATLRPHMAARAGIAARVQGMRRWYGLLLCADNHVRLVKALDGEHVLAEVHCPWELDRTYELTLTVQGHELVGFVDGTERLRAHDLDRSLHGGAIALVADTGRVDIDGVSIKP